MNINLFKKNYVTPQRIDLTTLMERMQSGKYGKKVSGFREYIKTISPGDTCPETQMPPQVYFSSRLDAQKRWVGYTGLVMVEVNKLSGRKEANAIRDKVKECLPAVGAFVGLSGRSVKILTHFTRPDGSLPATRLEAERFHAHAYRRAVSFYRLHLDRDVTWREPSLETSCRVSSDPDLYYNPGAIRVTMEQPLEMPSEQVWNKPEQPYPAAIGEHGEQVGVLFDMVLLETIRETQSEGYYYDSELFLCRLAENCFRSGIPEHEAVKRCRIYSRLGKEETALRLKIRNAYLLEKGFGEKIAVPPMQLMTLQMQEFMQRRYELRRNVLKKNVEYKERDRVFARFRPVTDEALNTMSMEAHLEGLGFWDRDVKRYIYSNHIAAFDPLEEFLGSLPGWDGKDHIGELAATLPTDHPHWPLCFYRWFLGMVAQWKGMNRMHANCVVPLISGEQSAGKSTWCKRILPPGLQDYYTEHLDVTSRRNAEMALNRFALINLDEFDSIPESKQPLLKHLLQLPEVAIRRPHSSYTEHLPRHASFIGTCNPSDILTDPTGSRRFLCVEVRGKIAYDQPIDYPQLYAQAVAALKQGERYWPDRQEEALMTEHNDAFSRLCPEEELLVKCFRPATDSDDQGEWLAPTEILAALQRIGRFRAGRTTQTAFGRILRKYGYIKKHAKGGNLYKVVREV